MSWIVETFVATTLLMLLVLAIRRPVARHFGPGIAYALWSLPVLRMFLPPLPGEWQFTSLIAPFMRSAESAPGMAMGLLNPDALPPQMAGAAMGDITVQFAGHHAALAVVPPTAIADGPDVLTLLIGLWAIGALGFLAYHLIAHNRFCAALLRKAHLGRTVADGRVHVIETDAATGPLAFGIWRKYVAFPRDFHERYDPLERNLALAHELGHHIRGDLIANWVALVVLAFHWFNPVAWRAFRAFRADQEMACDALVLSGRAPALRHAYGCAIVKSAHGGAVSAACHLHTINELKGRLKMLSTHNRQSSGRRALGMFAATGIAAAALIGTASGSKAGAAIEQASERAATALAVPATPDTPVPPALQAVEAPLAPVIDGDVSRHVTTTTGDDGKTTKHTRIVMRDKGGKTTVYEGAEAEAFLAANPNMVPPLPPVPAVPGVAPRAPAPPVAPFAAGDVLSRNCPVGEGKAGENVIRKRDGDRKITIICTNRIEREAKAAALAGVDAEKISRDAMRGAITSLNAARSSIASADMTAEDRAEALAGIDEAQREMEAELRKGE